MMDSSKNVSNNLFMWATKELSQDALIAWLLNWKEGNVGKLFLNSMIEKSEHDYEIEEIYTQKDHIDVLVKCKRNSDDTIFYVIIEDKTNTFLHSNQMIQYISDVSKYEDKKFNKIYYVLFKTGEIYGWERKEFYKQKKMIEDKFPNDPNKNEVIKFEIPELNDTIKKADKELLISGSWAKKPITAENKNVEICNIYDAENFSTTYEEIEKKISHEISQIWGNIGLGDYIKNVKNKNFSEYDIVSDFYNVITELLKKNDEGYETRVVLPSGQGERDYDCCIYHKKFFNYEKNGEEVNFEKLDENYLILPFINLKRTDEENYKISFKIQYQVIADYKIKNGYKPYSELKKVSKEEIGKRIVNAKNEFENIKWYNNNKRKNPLLFFKYEMTVSKDDLKTFIDKKENLIISEIKNNITTLIDISIDISNKINKKQ